MEREPGADAGRLHRSNLLLRFADADETGFGRERRARRAVAEQRSRAQRTHLRARGQSAIARGPGQRGGIGVLRQRLRKLSLQPVEVSEIHPRRGLDGGSLRCGGFGDGALEMLASGDLLPGGELDVAEHRVGSGAQPQLVHRLRLRRSPLGQAPRLGEVACLLTCLGLAQEPRHESGVLDAVAHLRSGRSRIRAREGEGRAAREQGEREAEASERRPHGYLQRADSSRPRAWRLLPASSTSRSAHAYSTPSSSVEKGSTCTPSPTP